MKNPNKFPHGQKQTIKVAREVWEELLSGMTYKSINCTPIGCALCIAEMEVQLASNLQQLEIVTTSSSLYFNYVCCV